MPIGWKEIRGFRTKLGFRFFLGGPTKLGLRIRGCPTKLAFRVPGSIYTQSGWGVPQN